MTGTSYATSAEMAGELGALPIIAGLILIAPAAGGVLLDAAGWAADTLWVWLEALAGLLLVGLGCAVLVRLRRRRVHLVV